MANATAGVPTSRTNWGDDLTKREPVGSTAAYYYKGAMIGLNASGLAVKCANTAGILFDGLVANSGPPIQTIAADTTNPDHLLDVARPFRFTMTINTAVTGADINRAVYAVDDNHVDFSTSNSIHVGWIDRIISSTEVEIRPVWAGVRGVATFDGETLAFTGATGLNILTMPDNLADAFSIKEGSNSYLTFVTTDSADEIQAKRDLSVANGVGLIVGAPLASQQTVSDGDGATNLVPEVQILGTAKADSSVLLAAFNTTDTTAVAPSLNFLKSGNGTIGSKTVVASGEVLGEINFFGDDGTDYESAAARIAALVDTTPGTGDMPGRLVFSTTADAGETLTTALTINSSQQTIAANRLTSSHATAGVGYSTGAGGTVTQLTDRSTGVTINKVTGTITTDTTSLAAGAEAEFTVTNSAVAATDTVVVSLASGSSGVGTCVPIVTAVASGSFKITISNQHASTAETGACVLNFCVLKGVAA